MMRNLTMVAVMVVLVQAGGEAGGQKVTAADTAAKLTGTWKLNRELSPSVTAPGERGSGRRGGSPSYAVGAMVAQRGGRGGGDAAGGATSQDLTPEELAGQTALRQLQQVAELITIKASAESVTFSDTRGERTYPITDKAVRLDAAAGSLTVKTRWDKLALRQEFSIPTRKLIKTWAIEDNDRLVLKVRLESMTVNTPDVKAVFDRQ